MSAVNSPARAAAMCDVVMIDQSVDPMQCNEVKEGLATFLCSGGSIAATPNSTVVKADLAVNTEYRTLSDHDAAVHPFCAKGGQMIFLSSGRLLLCAETLDRRSSVPPEAVGKIARKAEGRLVGSASVVPVPRRWT
jgi:hypothetical protein